MVSDNGIGVFPGGKYLLDGYQTLHGSIIFNNNGKMYSLQRYQKKHKNEYIIKNSEGYCYLYKNGILEMVYKEENGKRQGDFISLEKGRISFIQDSDNILNTNRWIRKVNDKRGELSEIWEGGRMVYRGKLNEKNKREGLGVAYDKECDVEYEGVFKNDVCIQMLKIFEGDEMIELLNNGNNVDVSDQIPIYVGGWKIDDNGEYFRDGIGYLIDIDKRIAYAEVLYENGLKVKQRELFDGWYHENKSSRIEIDEYPKQVSVPAMDITLSNSTELMTLNVLVTRLVISSNCCNDVSSLNLSQYKILQSIEIGNECFGNVDIFRIDGLNHLKSIKIGMSSFTHLKGSDKWDEKANNQSRSFHILNCVKLELIDIAEYSFSDYGGEFELKNLTILSSIKIGAIGGDSYSFCHSSFVVKDLPNLQSIELGDKAFQYSSSTVISNLSNLRSIKLGGHALCGRNDDSCSLEMKDLPKLEEITSDRLGYSFFYTRSVIISNIPNLKTVNLPDSFQHVKTKSITSVFSALLVKRVKVGSVNLSNTLAIDFGTTNSTVSYWIDNDAVQLCNVTCPGSGQSYLFPSFVAYRGDEVITGYDVKILIGRKNCYVISNVKRLIGLTYESYERMSKKDIFGCEVVRGADGYPYFDISGDGSCTVSCIDVACELFKWLKKEAENIAGREFTHAYVTRPVYFGENQVSAIREAAHKAGLIIDRMISEPCAAAISWCFKEDERWIRHNLLPSSNVLVIDFEGDRLDVSVVNYVGNNQFKVIASDGDPYLGDNDINVAIVDFVLKKLKRKMDIEFDLTGIRGRRILQVLKQRCKEISALLNAEMKEADNEEEFFRVNDNFAVCLDIYDFVDAGDDIEISVKELYEAVKDLIDRFLEPVKKITRKPEQKVETIRSVVLVGNSVLLKFIPMKLRSMGFDHPRFAPLINSSQVGILSSIWEHILSTSPFWIRHTLQSDTAVTLQLFLCYALINCSVVAPRTCSISSILQLIASSVNNDVHRTGTGVDFGAY